MYTQLKQNKGVALLFVVIISGLLVGIGAAMMRIFAKDVILTSTTRESTTSLYQADSGYECALFHDYDSRVFATTSSSSNIQCAGQTVTLLRAGNGNRNCLGETIRRVGGGQVFSSPVTFWLGDGLGSGGSCTCVDVHQQYVADIRVTQVESRGYNTCDETSDRRLERAIRVRY